MVATKHMVQGSGHAEDAFYYNVCFDPDFGFCCLAKVADFGKLEPTEVADTEVGIMVADIEQR